MFSELVSGYQKACHGSFACDEIICGTVLFTKIYIEISKHIKYPLASTIIKEADWKCQYCKSSCSMDIYRCTNCGASKASSEIKSDVLKDGCRFMSAILKQDYNLLDNEARFINNRIPQLSHSTIINV